MSTTGDLIAKRYANALWAAVGSDRAGEELKSFERFVEIYLSSDDLQKLFLNPAFLPEEKRKILAEVSTQAKFSKDFQNFLGLVLDRNRISILGSILESFKDKILKRDGISTVKIETALPITEAQQKKILSSLEKEFSSKFVASVDIVPELIAGLRLHFLGRTVDASLTGVLFQMRQKFLALEGQSGAGP